MDILSLLKIYLDFQSLIISTQNHNGLWALSISSKTEKKRIENLVYEIGFPSRDALVKKVETLLNRVVSKGENISAVVPNITGDVLKDPNEDQKVFPVLTTEIVKEIISSLRLHLSIHKVDKKWVPHES